MVEGDPYQERGEGRGEDGMEKIGQDGMVGGWGVAKSSDFNS